jgi:serine/threonine-protein kinase
VAPTTKINVRIGTGKVPVPNVVGKSQSEAQTTIAGLNLKVQTSFKQTNDAPEGTVVSQSPRDGTLDIGGTVKITVAQKPAPTVTPTTATPTPTPTPSPSDSSSPTVPPSP